MELSNQDFKTIRNWMYRNARPVDLARWQYHFENGNREAVLSALSAYQNEDGGFGHALEADSWNPSSSPIQTWCATEILYEVGMDDKNHPIIQGILKYIESGSDFENGRWNNTVISNNHYPHAPWWHTDSNSTSRSEYNPTAPLCGFILSFEDRSSDLYDKAESIAKELISLFKQNPNLEMHPLMCFVSMIDYIKNHSLQDQLDLSEVQELANSRISYLIHRDAQNWSGYSCKPSAFIHSIDSPVYEANKYIVNKELDYILAARNIEGIWDISWSWGSYDKEFAISENWWKGDIAIKNLLHLKEFGRISSENILRV